MKKIISGFPSTSQDNYQLSVINIMKHAVRNFGRQEIVCQTAQGLFRYTYRDAYQRVKRLANALEGIGARVGDRIGVLDWNTYRHYEMYFGIPGTGAVLLLLNLRLSPVDLSYVVNHAEAKFIFVDETLIPVAEAIAPLCKTVRGYIVLTDRELSDIKTSLSPIYSYEELLKGAASHYQWPVIDEKSAYAACYTTGTTDKPKGIYYSHRGVYLHSMTIALNINISCRDAFFLLTPMFHAMGWGVPQAVTLVGGELVLPGMYSLEQMDALVALLLKEKVTLTAGAPAIFMPMLEYIRTMKEKPKLDGVRFLSGATEPSLDLMKGFYDLTGVEIIHAYGATETSPLVSVNRLKPWLKNELAEDKQWDLKRKQGYPAVGLDVKVVDSFGNELPRDGVSQGELWIRGPWVTGRYHNAPETENQFTEDAFWKSGDAGTMDEEGYLKITDRVKDLIKSGGEWISSVDMENEIMSHHAVLEAAVTGVEHPKWEERPVALVVLRDEHKGKISGADIVEYLAKKFAKWQLPEKVLLVEEIPKTSVGKFDKKFIRMRYKDIYLS